MGTETTASADGGYNPNTFTMNNDEAPPGMSFADLPHQGNYGVAAPNTNTSSSIQEHDEEANVEYAAGDGEADFLEELRQQEKIPSNHKLVTNTDTSKATTSFTTATTTTNSSTFYSSATPNVQVDPHQQDTPIVTAASEQPSKSDNDANQTKPFYQKPWFWGLAAVIVVAIVVVVIVIARSGGGGDDDQNNNGVEQNTPSNPSGNSFPTRAPSPQTQNGGQPSVAESTTEPPTNEPTDPPVQLQSCTRDSDCPLFACALETWQLGADAVCCPTGFRTGYVDSPNYETSFVSSYYCKDQANGKPCYNNDMCASGACVSNICQASLQVDTASCAKNSDCQSNACGYSNYTMQGEIFCCPSGGTTTGYYRPNGVFQSAQYCTGQPLGAACYDNDFCESQACVMEQCAASLVAVNGECGSTVDCQDSVCAYQFYTMESARVCCESKSSTSYVYRPNGAIASASYCTGQALKASCATNTMCQSDACVMGQCESDLRMFNEGCVSDSDCQNNQCGYQFYTMQASKVCCESSSTVSYVLRPNGDIDSEDYCAGQALNATCISHLMCESGACVMGQCEPDLRTVNETCAADNDCQNSACGYQTYEQSAEKVCCESGATVNYVYRPNGDIDSEDYCTNQALGDACGLNGMCASGVCNAGVCT